jgi:hypothetical protein
MEDYIGRACGTVGEKRDIYRILVRKPEGNRQLVTHRPRLEDNITGNVRTT